MLNINDSTSYLIGFSTTGNKWTSVIIVALWNTADHYIFVLLFFFLFYSARNVLQALY